MIFSSSTGQAVGILLPQWSYIPTNKLSPAGFLYPISKAMEDDRLLRFVLIVGKGKERVNLKGKDFFWNDVKSMSLPEYLVVDITGRIKDRIVTFTGIASDGKGALFAKDREIDGFSGMEDVFAYFGISESWNVLSGKIKPSCGIYRGSRIYVSEADVMLGILNEKASFPKGYDMSDLGRVEKLLERLGLFRFPENISVDEISKKLENFSEIEQVMEMISQDDRDTILR